MLSDNEADKALSDPESERPNAEQCTVSARCAQHTASQTTLHSASCVSATDHSSGLPTYHAGAPAPFCHSANKPSPNRSVARDAAEYCEG